MREALSQRGWHLGLVFLAVMLLGPTPAAQPLAEAVRAASRAMAAGRPAAALPALEAAIDFDPALAALSSTAATLALQAGRPDDALAFLDRADRVSGPESERACQRIDALLQSGAHEEALSLWASAPVECLQEIDLLGRILQAQREAGESSAARDTAEALARMVPTDRGVAMELGLLTAVRSPADALEPLRRARSGEGREALLAQSVIEAIEASRPRDAAAFSLAQVGQALARHDQWALAAEAFREALRLEPDYVEAQAYLGLALDRSGQDGRAHLEAAAAAAPGAALPHAFLGMHWQGRGDLERAQRELELAARLDPSNPAIAAQLGALYSEQGDIAAAKTAYRLAAELAPREPRFWLLLANFSLRNEIEVDVLGLPAARNARLLAPGDASAVNALGYAYFLLGDWTLAERFLAQAAALEPGWAQAHYDLGLLRMARGEADGARREFELARELDTTGRVRTLAERALEGIGQ